MGSEIGFTWKMSICGGFPEMEIPRKIAGWFITLGKLE
jgi:hypothetical protein